MAIVCSLILHVLNPLGNWCLLNGAILRQALMLQRYVEVTDRDKEAAIAALSIARRLERPVADN